MGNPIFQWNGLGFRTVPFTLWLLPNALNTSGFHALSLIDAFFIRVLSCTIQKKSFMNGISQARWVQCFTVLRSVVSPHALNKYTAIKYNCDAGSNRISCKGLKI